ncbi:MAG: glycosyltransferase family 9 protein, partial [bacterium]
LDVVVRPPAENLLETLPILREVIVYDKYGAGRGITGFNRLVRRLRAKNYSLALLPHRSLRSALLALGAGIPQRIGFDRGGGKWLHRQRIPYPCQLHEIQRNLELLRPFNLPIPFSTPTVPATAEDIQIVSVKMGKYAEKRCVALAPGSVWFTKRWLEQYYLELAQRLAGEGLSVIFIGGSADKDLSQRLHKDTGGNGLDLSGELTLRQTVELLRRCEALVTNDSAPTHLGIAARTRVLTIFGSTTPDFGFAPLQPQGRSLGVELDCRPCTDHGRRRCPQRHFRCMKELAPDVVFREIIQMVNQIPL